MFQVYDKPECKSYKKWLQSFDLEEKLWQSYCTMTFLCTIDTDLRWFQYKIMNRILFTNQLLFKLKLVESELCSFCHTQCETLIHFFCECNFSSNIWSELEKLIFAKTGFKIKFTKENILFGFKGSNNNAFNCLSIVVKRTLYNNKLQNKIPYFSQFISSITNYYRKEKYIAMSKCREDKFKEKWIILSKLFDT